MHKNLRSFIKLLQKEKEIVEVSAPVDPDLELAEITAGSWKNRGQLWIFTNVKGSPYPVATNLFGTRHRVDLAMGPRPEAIIRQAVEAIDRFNPTEAGTLWRERNWLLDIARTGLRTVSSREAPVMGVSRTPEQGRLAPTAGPGQLAGRRGTLSDPTAGLYRAPPNPAAQPGHVSVQLYSANQTGIHWQIHKGGGFHHYEADEQAGQPLPVTVFLGGPPALTLAAIAACRKWCRN
jgi:3-polyprenyl-4-hydroxybenzoate decarboxylase